MLSAGEFILQLRHLLFSIVQDTAEFVRQPQIGGGALGLSCDVRDYAATLNDKEQGMARQEAGSAGGATGTKQEIEAGMASMSKKFLDMGGQVYVDKAAVEESNKAL